MRRASPKNDVKLCRVDVRRGAFGENQITVRCSVADLGDRFLLIADNDWNADAKDAVIHLTVGASDGSFGERFTQECVSDGTVLYQTSIPKNLLEAWMYFYYEISINGRNMSGSWDNGRFNYFYKGEELKCLE